MDHLLFLAHRIPYPPNKGDKIRSYHLLRHLCRDFHVHLGCFVDDEQDWAHVETLKAMCGETYFARLAPAQARLKSLGGLLRGEPLTLAYYRHAGLSRWVGQLAARQPVERMLVFSSAMAQFVPQQARATRVIDFVDIDSDKWAQYAARKPWPARLIYQREARRLLHYERRIAAQFDAALFVSPAEAQLFRSLAPLQADKVGHFCNGVDAQYFSQQLALADPYPPGEQAIVFTGAMDYWPNIDAVVWFADAVLPAILARHPAAVFYIVGSRPAAAVRALAGRAGVRVTGTVADVRPYVAHAQLAVAPLRIARGIQNKVLEAMAMGKPVIVSAQALEGIDAQPGRDLMLAHDAHEFAALVNAQLAQPDAALGPAARRLVLDQFDWNRNLRRIDHWFAARAAAPAQGVL